MDDFIKDLWERIRGTAPELLPLFGTLAGEAKFGGAWIAKDIGRLPKGSKVLEVGGGAMLVSTWLASLGYDVVAIEPTGDGFSEFAKLRKVVMDVATVKPRIAECGVEDFTSDEKFDYAFSVNVMEHVDNPEQGIQRVSAVLKPRAVYRFLCPNYLFPYEPHFNIPLIINKRISEGFFRDTIYGHKMHDAAGVWSSLNWITVPKVKKWVKKDPSLHIDFNTGTLVWMLERAVKDEAFASRRSKWMVGVIRAITAIQLHQLAVVIPAMLQPIMDVRLEKR